MSLLLVFLQIQFVGLLVCVLILHMNMPSTVLAIIEKNSTRMDGTFSRRRNVIEKQSLDRSFVPVYLGMASAFVLTALIGLAVADLRMPWPELEVGSDMEFESASKTDIEAASQSQLPIFQWPLVSVYFLSSFLFCPMMIASLYGIAIKRYRSQANTRFMDYYRAESVKNQTSHIHPCVNT